MAAPEDLWKISDAELITGRDIFLAVCAFCRAGDPHDVVACRGHIASLAGARQEIVDYVNRLHRERLLQLEDAPPETGAATGRRPARQSDHAPAACCEWPGDGQDMKQTDEEKR